MENKVETEAKLLYTLVYCQECFVPAHWNCIGEKTRLIEFTKGGQLYYLFKCDKCENQSKQAIKCIVCNKEEGLLKKCEKLKKINDEVSETFYVH